MNSDKQAMYIPYLMRSLEQALRAGYSFRQAVDRVSHDVEGLDELAAELEGGAGLIESVADWASQRPEREAALIVGALRLQADDLGNVADTLGTLHRVLARA